MEEKSAAVQVEDTKTENTPRGTVRRDLVERAIQGDKDAISAVLESAAKTVLYYTSSTLRNRMDAEDAAQEVLVRLYTKIGTLKSSQKFGAWLKTIIVNETRRYMEKNYSHISLDISEHLDVEENDDSALPYASAEKNERSEAVKKSVDKLTERQKEAVYSVHYLGLSVKDTAKAMGIRSQSVNDNLKLAYKKIERDLHAEGTVSAYGVGLLPLGTEISRVLLKDAEVFSLRNSGWVSQLVKQCGLMIEGAAGVIASAVAGVGAATTTAGTAGVAAVAGGTAASIITPVVCVTAAAATVTAGAIGVNQYVKNREPMEPDPPAIVQPGPVATGGGIIFAGGAESEHINPKEAIVWVTDELNMLGWQISPLGSKDILFSGNGGSAAAIFDEMLERGMDGRYVIVFRMEDEYGGYYTVDREFLIQSETPSDIPEESQDSDNENPENQNPEEIENPENENPDSENPEESENPDSENPEESENPDSENPDRENTGNENPDSGDLENEFPQDGTEDELEVQ